MCLELKFTYNSANSVMLQHFELTLQNAFSQLRTTVLPNEVAFSSGASLATAMASSAEVSCSCLEYVGLRTALGNTAKEGIYTWYSKLKLMEA